MEIGLKTVLYKFFYDAIAGIVKMLIKLIQRHEVKDSGSINLKKLCSRIYINDFLSYRHHRKLKVCDLTEYFKYYVERNIPVKYIKHQNGSNKFIINHTRISTFFTFTDTDRSKILLFDRTNSNLQTVINNNYNCFGSMDFENSSLFKKITSSDFFNSDIERIDYIPRFAFEDNVETDDNFCIFQTVIMFGFIFYLSPENLQKALIGSKDLHLENLNIISMNNNLTSKAKLAVEYLKQSRGRCYPH